MMKRIIVMVLLLSLGLVFNGCEILEPDEEQQTVFDLSGVNQVDIDPEGKHYFNLGKDKYGGLYVNVAYGKKYYIAVTIESGSADLYYSKNSEIDIESENTSKININGTWLSPNWSGSLYILVVSKQTGTVVYVDVYTYNPNDVEMVN